jgi:hypothetical protein
MLLLDIGNPTATYGGTRVGSLRQIRVAFHELQNFGP